MNENIDLTKILKDCPKGWEFYSSIYGKLRFDHININSICPIVLRKNKDFYPIVTKYGRHSADYENEGECTIFPSKDQRDWSKFTAPWYKKEESIKPKFKVRDKIRHKETNKDYVYEISKVYNNSYGLIGFNWGICIKDQDQYELVPNKFDPKTLKPFDKVLVRDDYKEHWLCRFFSHIVDGIHIYKYTTIGSTYKYCIPYNDDTKHLVGTIDEAPEFYKYWKD